MSKRSQLCRLRLIAGRPSDGTVADTASLKAFEVSSATVNFRAYERRLQEFARANIQLPFRLAERLAKIESPFDIPRVLAELTIYQMGTFRDLVFPGRVRAELSLVKPKYELQR
jgi:hypothetical protein